MQTRFSEAQLADPDIARANEILRTCVHCGFCTATCPTYVTLGDERDSPRGRIWLIREMLETGGVPAPQTVHHVDRCLSCLSCMTTCPSGVHYMHLVDHARSHIERHHERPFADHWLRAVLAEILPYPGRFRLALLAAGAARPFSGLIARLSRPLLGEEFARRMQAMLRLSPRHLPSPSAVDRPQTFPATDVAADTGTGTRPRPRLRVALMSGCAQQVLDPAINEATVRLLNRLGCEVVIARGSGCCGALAHHMGHEEAALVAARDNVAAWSAETDNQGLDAIVINASGCGTTVKDYAQMLRNDPEWADRAAEVAARARDVTELLVTLGLPDDAAAPEPLRVTYHSACSLRHGQRVIDPPKDLLRRAGFTVTEPAEPHLCCGSAGTYNILQPDIADRLRDRKTANIAATRPQVVAAGNIGCMTQIAGGMNVPVVHTVELLDWATGGPEPEKLQATRNTAA